MIAADRAVDLVKAASRPVLVAIDGFPCAGKSTLAIRMVEQLGAQCVFVDDFVLPEGDWPIPHGPAYPFPFMRHGEFLRCVNELAAHGRCSYRPFDWETMQIRGEGKAIVHTGVVVVEGVSVLDERISDLFDLSFFVESDEESILETAARRGDGHWAKDWREYFLPSTQLYMQTDPRLRADYLVAGRGA